jgi:hypothetical protein
MMVVPTKETPMTRILTLALAVAIVGCQGTSPAAILHAPCATGTVDRSGLDPGVTPPAPFAFTVSTEPAAGATAERDVAEVNGAPMQFQADVLLLDFDAPDASIELPSGRPTGILSHREPIEPVLRDFDLELVEQMVLPILMPSPAPSAASTSRTTAKASFLVRVRNAEAVPLTDLQADAVAAGFGDVWTFHRAGAAGTFARAVQLTRAKPCYRLRGVGLNVYFTPA